MIKMKQREKRRTQPTDEVSPGHQNQIYNTTAGTAVAINKTMLFTQRKKEIHGLDLMPNSQGGTKN